jgi:uncharacterized C2H2 Zn-finger protein
LNAQVGSQRDAAPLLPLRVPVRDDARGNACARACCRGARAIRQDAVLPGAARADTLVGEGNSTMTAGESLWQCPRCGAHLLRKNLSHSCGDHSVEKFLRGKSERGRRLFASFAAMVARCGPHHVAPAKTRVAFMALVRFASVNRVGDDFIDVHLVLPRRLLSPRFKKVEHLANCYVHHLRLRDDAELAAELKAWLLASYHEYGERQWLRPAQRGSTRRGRVRR